MGPQVEIQGKCLQLHSSSQAIRLRSTPIKSIKDEMCRISSNRLGNNQLGTITSQEHVRTCKGTRLSEVLSTE